MYMKKVGIFYGSTLGYCKKIAEKIHKAFGEERADIGRIENFNNKTLEQYENFVFGTSTWGLGEMQEDWENFAGKLSKMDFSTKKIALFGVGDQKIWTDSFVNGMGMLYHRIPAKQNVVGFTPIEGYDFEISLAIKDDQFVGLAIDDVNQPELTDIRIKNWVDELKTAFGIKS
jgi:flavodoxin long chain